MMGFTRGVLLAVTLALAIDAGHAQGQFPAQVSTLALSDSLEAWGRLGGVTVDRLGFIYVANFRDAVWQIAPDGEVRMLTRSLYGSSGNAIDSEGNLLQANFYGDTISKVSRTGEVTTWVSEGLAGPVGLAVDSEDNLYVCNCTGGTISRVTINGTVSTFAQSDLFACPNGIAFDDTGTLFVTSFANNVIARVAPDGTVEAFASLPGNGNAHLAFAKGNLYVTQIQTNQVYQVNRTGDIHLVAGTGAIGFEDGLGPTATLARPNGIAVNPGGDVLYINTLRGAWRGEERGSLAIRRIELATVAAVVRNALETSGIEAATEAYRQYKEDPLHVDEPTEADMQQLGLQLLIEGKAQEAVAVFSLNADTYPDSWRAHERLGFVYAAIGQPEQAGRAYERSLRLNPENPGVRRRLDALQEN